MDGYKYSRFNSILDITSASTVLYNAFSDQCLVFLKEKKTLLSNQPDIVLQQDRNFFNNLLKIGAIISSKTNELKEIRKRSKKVDFDESEFILIINPTMNCNFKCWYCYETHDPHSQLSIKNLQKIFNLIDHILAKKKKLQRFVLSFFGGEPLLYYNTTTKKIIDYLRSKYAEYSNIQFSINFTSNGYLINEAIVRHLTSFPESHHFQITLDGGKEYHNKTRCSGKKEGSYHKILDSIKLLISNNIQVLLRINYTSENIDSVLEIIDDIKDIPSLDRKNLSIGLFRIWQDDKNINIKDKVKNIKQAFSDHGFVVDGNETILDNLKHSCYADKKNELLINFNGDVYKCTARDFNQENKYGSLNDDGEVDWIQEKIATWENVKLQSKSCKKCKILPLCGGGCHQINMETNQKDACHFNYNDEDKNEIVLMRLSEYFIHEEL